MMESNECCQHLELFEAECERYHNLIDEKDESLKKALAKIKTLEEKNAELEAKVESAFCVENRCTELSKTVSTLKNEIRTMTTDKMALERLRGLLTFERDEALCKANSWENETKELREFLKKTECALKEESELRLSERNRVSKLETELASLEINYESLKAHLIEDRAAFARLINEKEKKIQEYRGGFENMKSEYEFEIGQLTEKVRRITLENDQLKKAQFPSSDVELLKAKELSTQLKDVKALLEEKKEENRMLLTDNDKLIDQVSQWERKYKRLSDQFNQLKVLTDQMDEVKRQLAQEKKKNNALEEQIEEFKNAERIEELRKRNQKTPRHLQEHYALELTSNTLSSPLTDVKPKLNQQNDKRFGCFTPIRNLTPKHFRRRDGFDENNALDAPYTRSPSSINENA